MSDGERVQPGPQLNDDELLNRFAVECGMPESLRLVVREDGTRGIWKLDYRAPFIRVGRADHCHAVLADNAVSRRHAYLQVLGGQLCCFDLDSREGLQWSTGRRPQGLIDTTTGVHIGPFSLKLSRARHFGESQPIDFEAVHAVADDYFLQCLNASSRATGNTRRRTRRQITFLGRSKRCHVKLSDQSVKKFHCSLVRTAESFWVVDLSGDAGILVNGQRVAFAPIGCDDELGIGRFRMRLSAAGAESDILLTGSQQPHTAHPESVEAPEPQRQLARRKRNRPSTREQTHLERHIATPVYGVSEGVLLAVVEQMAQIQHYMLQQNHEQVQLVAQVLAGAHAAQQGPIAEQLRQLEQVTSELQELYVRTAREQATDNESDVPAKTRDDPAREQQVPRLGHSPAAPAELTPPDEPATDENGSDAEPDDGEAASGVEELESTTKTPRYRTDSASTNEANHLWLTQRINELERERQSRWQRIVSLISKSSHYD